MSQHKPSLFTLFLVVFTELIGFGLIIPVLPQLASLYQINYFSLGILMSAFSFAQFIAAPILGHWSDKIGRKPVLVISKFGSMLAYIILAFSKNYWMFLAARLLDGFTGGNIAVARAYIADITEPKNRSKGMALIGISFGLGFIIGPALGGFLHNGEKGQFITALVAASLSAIALLLTIFLLKEPQNKKEYIPASKNFIVNIKNIKHPLLFTVFGSYFVYMMVFSGFETTFVMFTEYVFKLTTKQNSLLFMYAGLIGLLVQGGLSRKSSKKLTKHTISGLLILSLGFLGMAYSTSIEQLLFFMTFFSIGIALINTFFPSLVSLYTTDHNRGFIMGIYESIGSISRIAGPLCAYSVSIHLIQTEYIGFSLLTLLVAIVLFIKTKQKN